MADSEEIAESYTFARFLEWAGDIAQAERHLDEFDRQNPLDSERKPSIQGIESLFVHAGKLRHRRLQTRTKDAEKLSAHLVSRGLEVSFEPLSEVIGSFRTVFWPISRRSVRALAFPKDLAKVEAVLAQARSHNQEPLVKRAKQQESRDLFIEEAKELPHYSSLGGIWVIDSGETVGGPAIIEVEVTDFGLIEIVASWKGFKGPEGVEAVRMAIQAVLNSLEPPGRDFT